MNALLPAPRILVVEDDPLFRASVRDALAAAGYRVDEAADGLEAVGRVAAGRHDLVLLDFDLPRMMGGEALERMLALRPGLVTLVLSGKDDLHQALWMGRRGAYGWIDKYVGQERLLQCVADGLRTRATGFDLARLVEGHFPQPLALPFVRWGRLGEDAPVGQRLTALREMFEALLEYLGVVVLASYVDRGLVDQRHAAVLSAAVRSPAPGTWSAVLAALAPELAADPRRGWVHELAVTLLRPLPDQAPLAASAQQMAAHALADSVPPCRSLLDWLQAAAAFHADWLLPARLPQRPGAELAARLDEALRLALAALAVLADAELVAVREVAVGAGGQHEHHLAILSGVMVQNRPCARPQPLQCGRVYLRARPSGEWLTTLAPLAIYDACETPGAVSESVFVLSRFAPHGRATYYSQACGETRILSDSANLEAVRRLLVSLDPKNDDDAAALQDVAVALFDLSQYTALTHERGPDAAREFVRRMVSVVSDVVGRHGGRVVGAVGDELLACFDRPADALRSAVETLRTLLSFNQRNPAAELHVHVGLDFGPAAVEGNQVWGDVVNRAKRCQMLAGRDEIVISAALADTAAADGYRLRRVAGDLKGLGATDVFYVQWEPPAPD